MSKTLYKAATGVSNIFSTIISSAHNAATSVASIEVASTTLGIGDSIEISLGYDTDFDKVFTGYVKTIDRNSNDNKYLIGAQDVMVRAVDYFIASSTPDVAFSRENIAAEELVRQILALAGLTSFVYDATSFTFATQGPLEVNLISAYDISKQISDILAWHLYADENGQIHFVDRKPYVTGSDSPTITITDSNILVSTHTKSDQDLRNRVVVYGKGEVAATAQATSPYLPSGFYKSTVLATEFIDNQSNAQLAANYNLTLLNRLNESLSLQIEGNSNIFPRMIVHVTDSILGIDSNWYVYAVNHRSSADGYITELELRA